MAQAAFWDRIAPKYAATPIKDFPSYEQTLERAASYLRSDDHVLEAGCGTGTTALKLAPFAGSILGTDASGKMVSIAAGKSVDMANVSFRQASALARDLGHFDAVMAFNLLHLVEDQDAVLSAFHAQMKPGGYFISKTPCLGEMSIFLRLIIPVMQKTGFAPFVRFQRIAELEEAIARNGFEIVESSNLPVTKRNRFIVARRR